MPDFTTYKNIRILDTTPQGDGGAVLNDNFRTLADATATYTHVQSEPADVWVIQHNLGRPVQIVITDESGEVMYGDLYLTDMNTVTMKSNIPVTGTAYAF